MHLTAQHRSGWLLWAALYLGEQLLSNLVPARAPADKHHMLCRQASERRLSRNHAMLWA